MIAVVARLVAPLFALAFMLAGAVPVLAHAQMLSSVPAANAMLAQAPAEVSLVFNEPVSPLVITLIGPGGDSLDLTATTMGGETVVVPLPAEVDEGTHVLSWRVVSVDAHPVAGSVVFSIGSQSGTVPDIAAASLATSILLWASKTALFATLFLGLGTAIFALAAPLPDQARRLAGAVNLLGLVVAPVSLGLHGADALGVTPMGLFSPDAWVTGYATRYGLTTMLLVAALLFGLISLHRFRVLALIGWGLAALALALSGHAGAAEPQWLTRIAVVLHIAGILFWIGALLPLSIWLREQSHAADRALRQFSRFIPFAVAPILISGGVLAAVQMGPPGPAWLAPYGVILAAKLGLMIALLGLAVWNRFRLTHPALEGTIRARGQLRKAILLEIGLVLIIFALAAGWRFTPPPRAIAAAAVSAEEASAPLYAHAMDQEVMADLVITPGRAGPVAIDIGLTDLLGAPVEPLTVELTLSAPELGIEPIKVPATLRDGLWRVEGQTIPLPGPWDFTLDLRLDRFTLARVRTQIILP
ncbi:copper resistance CopC/CopD family protein [Devosia chinhatensis]|uniref:Copper resistance protein CopC n=1 Tax=Devosia chinhatensis TaxID=429727 RepID=A0A0F5FGL5_9HYPH|nr:copper resistance protein CopC [Devosia chinhatensis]KKB08001.1 hypothetical protein VE26_15540 [Devosia chinhatensis]